MIITRHKVHELVHFVIGLEAFFVTHVCEDCWADLQSRLSSANSVATLRASHDDYILSVWRHCLLDDEVRHALVADETNHAFAHA